MTQRGGALERAWSKVSLVRQEIFDLGLKTMGQIALNSVSMARHEAKWKRAKASRAAFILPGVMGAITSLGHEGDQEGHGLIIAFGEGNLELAFLSPELLRMSWSQGAEPMPYARSDDATWSGPAFSWDHDAGAIEIRSSAMQVRVDADGSVTLRRLDGRLVAQYSAPGSQAKRQRISLLRRDGEQVCGLGEQAQGVALSAPVRLFNRDPGGAWGVGHNPLYCAIPVVLGVHPDASVLTFAENSFESEFVVGDEASSWTFEDGKIRLYVTIGSVPEVLTSYARLTGRSPRPPRWALGFHQCRWGYKTAADIARVAGGFASRSLPVSALHCDIDYMQDYRVFTINAERFPSMSQLSQELSAQGARIVTIVDPAMKRDQAWPLYAEGLSEDHFVTKPGGEVYHGTVWPGRAAFPDFTRPRTRAWWAGHYRELLDEGVSGIWHDMNEPTSLTLNGDRTLPRDLRFDLEGRGGEHAEAHNLYGLAMNRAGFDGLRAARRDRRPFIVSRSGWAGMQRYAWNWTADVESSFAGLRQQIATVVGLGLSGVPFSGSDIGGFSGSPNAELFLRWFEMASFHPFFRTHSVVGVPSREPWTFGAEAEGLLAGLLAFRYRLLPYLYTVADEAVEFGHPWSRPRWWLDEEPKAQAGDDEGFLVGSQIYVAPVTQAKSARMTVTLPAGRWRQWMPQGLAHASADHFGPSLLASAEEIATPLGSPAIFVAEGSIVITDDAWRGDELPALHADHRVLEPLITVLADQEGKAHGLWFDDAGDGYGAWRRSTFTLARTDHGTQALTWISTGDFPLPASVKLRIIGLALKTLSVDGHDQSSTPSGEGESLMTEVTLASFTRLEWKI